jgi:hypothetical protein
MDATVGEEKSGVVAVREDGLSYWQLGGSGAGHPRLTKPSKP